MRVPRSSATPPVSPGSASCTGVAAFRRQSTTTAGPRARAPDLQRQDAQRTASRLLARGLVRISHQQRDGRERRGSGQRAKVHLPSLALHLPPLRGVIDGLGTLIHVALTSARGQLHSGSSQGLEKAEPRQPEGEEKDQSPRPRSACGDQRNAENDGHRKGSGPEDQTAAPLAWTDVRRAHSASVHCSLSTSNRHPLTKRSFCQSARGPPSSRARCPATSEAKARGSSTVARRVEPASRRPLW